MKAWITKDEKNNIEFVVCDDEVGDDREIFRYTSLFAFQSWPPKPHKIKNEAFFSPSN